MIGYGEASRAAIAELERGRAQATLSSSRSAEETRKRRALERWLLMHDDYEELVREHLASIFHDDEQRKRVVLQSDTSLNVFKEVVEEIYTYAGAERAFVLEGEVDKATQRPAEVEDPVYRELLEEAGIPLLMGEVSLGLGAARDLLVRIEPDDVCDENPLGLPTTRIYWPHEVSVRSHPKYPGIAGEVRYTIEREDGSLADVVWTKEHHYIEGPDGEPQRVDGAEGMGNPYGRLPFVSLHIGARPDRFWDPHTGEDLKVFTLDYNAGWASVKHLMHQQSFIQLIVKGLEQGQTIGASGPGVVHSLGENVSLTTIDMQADPRGPIDALVKRCVQKLRSYGINAERLLGNPGQAPPSGIARLLERAEVQKFQRAVRPYIVRAERAVSEAWRWAYNFNHPRVVNPKARFRVRVLDEPIIESPSEVEDLRTKRLANVKAELALGARTEAEAVAELRGVSLEAATTFIAHRKLAAQKPEVFAYDQENGVLTLDEIRAAKGLPPHPNPELGKLTVPEFKALIESKTQPDDEPNPAGFRPPPPAPIPAPDNEEE